MPDDSSREVLPAASSVSRLKGVGPARERALREAGVESIRDLLLTLPLRYEDRRLVTELDQVRGEGTYTLAGRLRGVSTVRLYRRRMTLVRATLVAGEASLPVVWFNRPYLAGSVEEEEEYLLHGRVRRRGQALELLNPSLESRAKAGFGNRVVPVYPGLGTVGPTLVRSLIGAALAGGALETIEETLPPSLLERNQLPTLSSALRALHAPPEDSDAELLNQRSTPAHARLVYGELLRHQTELALARRRVRDLRKNHRYDCLEETRRAVTAGLPFRLTRSQEKVLDEILGDLGGLAPMMRLLQGDVGCGKTVVAAVALAAAAENGLQAVLMAPTELLAEQHFRSLAELLGEGTGLRLVTSAAGNAKVRDDLRSGRAAIAVGTHALLQDAVDFQRLGLVVVDEQHRFGVDQRRSLLDKGHRPDLLVMTATPIPRSLAMTLYGDLSLSIIEELPPGRAPVATRVVSEKHRREAYLQLKEELDRGNRAFVVLPLIEDSDRVKAEAVEGLGRRLAARLASYRPLVLHGRMAPEEKSATMEAFAQGEAKVLIATTLVEVGVDVGDATVMVIESAERFGLAQLHQLRGRVGRGERSSTCIAVHGRLTDDARRRLEIFEATTDGFALAEADLEIRGPGDLLGTRQSGVPALRITDLAIHREWIETARRDARELVRERSAEGTSFLERLESEVRRAVPLAGA